MTGQGVALIKAFERLDAYRDLGGVWTTGYGHTGGVVQGDEITEVEASDILLEDLAEAESHVARLGCPLSQL